MTNQEERKSALVKFLGLKEKEDIEDVWVEGYTENLFTFGNQEYLVLTDAEADKKAKEEIQESVWAFNSNFLANMTDIDEVVYKALQPKCESSNDAILKLIDKTCGLDEFVSEAISSDGRGHFLAGYDGNENEEGEYFIYRTN